MNNQKRHKEIKEVIKDTLRPIFNSPDGLHPNIIHSIAEAINEAIGETGCKTLMVNIISPTHSEQNNEISDVCSDKKHVKDPKYS